MFKHLATFLKIGLSVSILAFLCYQASSDKDFGEMLKTKKKWEFLLLAQLFVLAGMSLSFIRWQSLVEAVGIRFSKWDALRIGFIGHMFGCISIGTFGNDAIRIYYVSRENPTKKTEALATVFVDRLCGLMGLFSLTTLAMIWFQYYGDSAILSSHSRTLQSITWISVVLTILGFCGFGSLFILPYVSKTRLVRWWTQVRFFGPINTKLLAAGLAFQKRPSVLVFALFQSVCVHVLLTLGVYCVAVGLSVPHPSFGDHFIISPIAHLASVLPLPGGFGGLEGALWFFYRSISDDPENSIGFLVALAYRIGILVAAGVGIVFYLRGKKEIEALAKMEEDFDKEQENG